MKTIVRHIAPLAALLALAAAPAAAQDTRLATRLDERTRSALVPLLDSARAVGIPTEPLVQKALEGASKRAAGDRIVVAVRRLAGQLGTARVALGAEASDAELVAGASALQAGVRREALASLRGAHHGVALTVPLGVMAELVARGVPADTAAMAVAALTDAGVGDAQLVSLRKDVERDVAVGAPPTTALIARVATFTDAGGTSTFRPIDRTATPTSTTTRRRP